MKQRAILMNGPMVRATLKGWKTNTRRLDGLKEINLNPDNYELYCFEVIDGNLFAHFKEKISEKFIKVKSKAGKIGDRLWVRETWGVGTRPCASQGWYDGLEYKADEAYCIDEYDCLPCYPVHNLPDEVCLSDYADKKGWTPSIFMPRWASRITLEITDVRVERLQDISEEDAKAEGVEHIGGLTSCEHWKNYGEGRGFSCAQRSFHSLWNSIYGPESWEKNPWCWAITFKRIEK